MNTKDFDPENAYNKMQKATNAAGRPMYSPIPEAEIKVQIYPDKSVAPAMFIPNKTIPGTYRAHPVTIAAMRSDLFAGTDDEPFADLELNIKCEGCAEVIDAQFWVFCPYCEKSFPKHIIKQL